jgi:hypothetical protein
MSNDISVFPVALLENAVTGPITYQGEEVRGSPTYANNSANAIVRVAIPADKRIIKGRPFGVGFDRSHHYIGSREEVLTHQRAIKKSCC